VRRLACADCVVSVLLGAPTAATDVRPELDRAEQAALAVLAGSGLVPPLRLVPPAPPALPAPPAPGAAAGGQPGQGRAATG
jgi:hypothetical protein